MVLPGTGGDAKSEVYDYYKLMRFDESGIFEAQPVKVYELEHDRWLTGSLPTNNYPAGLTVYRLVYANFQDEQALIEKQ